MAFKKIVNQRRFWKLVIIQGLAFALLYQVISMLFEYGGLNFSAYFEDNLEGGRWIRFAIGTVVAAFLYGFIISYGQFRTRLKNEERH